MRKRDLPSRRGFTLVELAMVAAIIGILALIAVPRYTGSIQRYQVESAARRIALDMDLARQSAVQASQRRDVFFDSATTSYVIPFIEHLDHRGPHYTVDLKGSPYRATLLLTSFTDSSVANLAFNGFGQPNTGATIRVRVGSIEKLVVVDAVTGLASVQ